MEPGEADVTATRLHETINATRAAMREAHAAINAACDIAGRSDAGRSLAIARTELETAMLWLDKGHQQGIPATNV